MQLIETTASASKHVLLDEIYAPSLNTPLPNSKDVQAAQKAQQHLKAINELHRFLESSCDCV